MKKQFIVIGLGRFGMSLTKTLIQNKHEVLAVDKELHLVEAISEIATQAVQGDCTDEEVLAELGVDNFNHAIVAVDKSLETSIMVTLLLKEMGVPKVTAKAKNALHGKMLKKIGADQIIHPERDMGIRLGQKLSSENLIDYIELSPDYNLVEMSAPATMAGQSLQQLDFRAVYGCNVVAIKHGKRMNISPLGNTVIQTGDTLLVIGKNEDIHHLEAKYESRS